MPQAVSHTEAASFVLGSSVYLLGGQCALDASNEMGVTAAIQKYDARLDEWSIVGTLPYRVKTGVAGHHDGWIYIVGGQRDRSATDARPGAFVNQAWRARLPSAAR
jgi:N-acetylneuraminic acid mutarotase